MVWGLAMQFEQLTGRYIRLRQELESAYAELPWRDGHIDRLASELASVERELSIATRAGKTFNELILDRTGRSAAMGAWR